MEHQTPSRAFVFGTAVYLMLWVAIFNGYPTVYDDTGEYLSISFTPWQSPYRSIIYGFFIRLASWGITPWLIILAQSAITIYVLRAVFEYVVQKRIASNSGRYFFPGLVVFLTLATSLPWFVGQLMPDVFTALAFLIVFLLLYTQLSLSKELFAFSSACSLGGIPSFEFHKFGNCAFGRAGFSCLPQHSATLARELTQKNCSVCSCADPGKRSSSNSV